MTLIMTSGQLAKIISKFSSSPGIYFFSARGGPAFGGKKFLYIGKAANLRGRLRSYLPSRQAGLKTADSRIQKMISLARRVEFKTVESDIEALILESQYIKKYKPAFNIMMRDDKQYGFVDFTHSTGSGRAEKFPKIFVTHQPAKVSSIKYQVLGGQKSHNTKYIIHNTDFVGPFTDIGALKTTLRYLRRIFPYCTCKQLHHNYCLNYHIGKCPGFCCLKDSPERFMVSGVEPSRRIAEEKLYNKNIKAIKSILSGKKNSLLKNLEKEMVASGKKGDFREAIDLQRKIEKIKRVFRNAHIIQNSSHDDTSKNHSKSILSDLKQILGLKTAPFRIEAYDIANIQGKYAVGAMIVFTLRRDSPRPELGTKAGQANWKPDKNEYRKFKIRKKDTPDDTMMIGEILTRRLQHSEVLRTPKSLAKEWPMPDLILVDGGKAQLNATRSIITKLLNYPITILALTKNEKHKGEKIYISGKIEPIPLSQLPQDVKNLILQINSEAHRFAIGYYRKLHRGSVETKQS